MWIKRSTLLISILLFLAIVFVSFERPNYSDWKDTNVGRIGDVKYSLLNFEEFKEQNGCGWMKLNGSPLDESTSLYQFFRKRGVNMDSLPNADGMFIRSIDTKPKDDYGDPEAKERKVGKYQEDQVGGHVHKNAYYYVEKYGGKGKFEEGMGGYDWEPKRTDVKYNVGKETRPQNIALYTYIKIHYCE